MALTQLNTEAAIHSSASSLNDLKISDLKISEDFILETSQRLFPASDFARIVLRQAFYENWLKLGKRVNFRFSDNRRACDEYSKMSTEQFHGINARQAWANWRTIPRNLSTKLPSAPLRAIDLCSGTGHSTEVLAHYLPLGSQILGLEFNAHFVELASRKQYKHQSGASANVRFRAQSVLETFMEDGRTPVSTHSIDVVNCVGAVGHHFVPAQTRLLAAEVKRVLKAEGIALIDSGEAGTKKQELVAIFEASGFMTVGAARSCFLDPYEQVCFKKLSQFD